MKRKKIVLRQNNGSKEYERCDAFSDYFGTEIFINSSIIKFSEKIKKENPQSYNNIREAIRHPRIDDTSGNTKSLYKYIRDKSPKHTFLSKNPICILDAFDKYGKEHVMDKLLSGIPIYEAHREVCFDLKDIQKSISKCEQITIVIDDIQNPYDIKTSEHFETYVTKEITNHIITFTISTEIEHARPLKAYIIEQDNQGNINERPIIIHTFKINNETFSCAEYKNSVYFATCRKLYEAYKRTCESINYPRTSFRMFCSIYYLFKLKNISRPPTLNEELFQHEINLLYDACDEAFRTWIISSVDIESKTDFIDITTYTDKKKAIAISDELKHYTEISPRDSPELIEKYISAWKYFSKTSGIYGELILIAVVEYMHGTKDKEIVNLVRASIKDKTTEIKSDERISRLYQATEREHANKSINDIKALVKKQAQEHSLPQMGNKYK
ncbi:hypothetical protein [Nitratidesulfovibrio liaohensis]|uniref:Uncharacterized protein n=1 Tax=Nitratidesulfovibrio liaohensis TaxID=2604158 RepID=A0ABY9R3G7_9BACT|nr:hypothetical protein [Nitratidesulfovibrio liaohensis]WMW66306.1 hypothetical protein KPS_000872 [Nitratidesulfovibrio liaohensis]